LPAVALLRLLYVASDLSSVPDVFLTSTKSLSYLTVVVVSLDSTLSQIVSVPVADVGIDTV